MDKQRLLYASDSYSEVDEYLIENDIKSLFLVCDASLKYLRLNHYFESLENRLGIEVCYFDRFAPNPLYESVEDGVDTFLLHKCDAIIAVGGGSAIDVAKCVKLYCGMSKEDIFLRQEIVPNNIPFMAIPTTAGTGSEATRFAVVYYKGEKQSVTHESIIPGTVLFDSSVLDSLPDYQRKSTFLDALCHATESFWSVNSTPESKEYARESIQIIMNYKDLYLVNDKIGNAKMQEAAFWAGKAINISQTTAGHAMCYKISSLYNVAHGHAAALCVRVLFPWMLDNMDRCIDPRGIDYLRSTFNDLAVAYGVVNSEDAAIKFGSIFSSLNLMIPKLDEEELEILTNSVNPVRLKNNPISLDKGIIGELYKNILAMEA